jgi:enediyne biosynthesis protein E4
VYINNGNGTFKSITDQLPRLSGYASWGCAIGNIGADAYPDIVFAHATGFHKGQAMPGKIYTNDSPSLTFKPTTGLMLTDSLKPYTVPYWSDYDLDGDMDLFVASGPGGKPGPDFCYKNMRIETGKSELKPITSETFAYTPQDGQCYNFIDVDNDRDLDLCLTNYRGASTHLYKNTKGNFMTETTPFTGKAGNLSNNWGDFDNDGDLDVIITSDGAKTKHYKNNGAGVFAEPIELTKAGGAGVSNGDYDNDGDLDVFVHGIDSAVALFNNSAVKNGNHWVNIKCTGIASGSSALGTVVTVQAKVGGKVVIQTREINAQNSFLSQNDLRVHVGLGDAKVIDAVTIKYANGKVQTFKNVKPDTFYMHDEGAKGLTAISK